MQIVIIFSGKTVHIVQTLLAKEGMLIGMIAPAFTFQCVDKLSLANYQLKHKD